MNSYKLWEVFKINKKMIFLISGLFALLTCFFMGVSPLVSMGVIALIMAFWWIFEVLPLAGTALLPLVCYPMLGIMSTKKVAPVYMSSILMLFIGGFTVALAMQKWNLHKRIALKIVSFFGTRPSGLLMGFMVATSLLSMWISNTATCVMMVSIGLAVIKSFEDIYGDNGPTKVFSSTLMMGIAYAATIGGVATIVGTPPNLAFVRIYSMNFPEQSEFYFSSWLVFGLPICLLMLLSAFCVLYFMRIRKNELEPLSEEVISKEVAKLGPMKKEEKWVGAVFVTMALLWVFRKKIAMGALTIPGWSELLPRPELVDDGTVAIMMALLLFMIPTEKGGRIIDKKVFEEIPWGTILLFGGGFALAKGIQETGLSQLIGEAFLGLKHVSPTLIISSLTLGMSLLTELTSNMASTEMLLPILAAVAKSSQIPPLSLMIPATLAASCAFMFPAATAPNAIIFGSKRVGIGEMIKSGFLINLVCVFIITLFSLFFIPFFFPS